MKNLNPLKIGKYTFWVSFIIGNIFMFGHLLDVAINNHATYRLAIGGYMYLFVAAAANLIILFALLIWGIVDVEKRKQCFKGIAMLLINIPLAFVYAIIALELL
ncbi:MAG: hypothetical protein FWC39_02835 [Bacteroidetes bacterium]|nr:hypothetical protein [Bacteroidota bacterium]